MPGPASSNKSPQLSFHEDDSRAWAIIACALFLVRIMPWTLAELWHDEILTLQYFVFGGEDSSLLGVFRNYSMANNHFLNSALYWWWVRFLDFSFSEHILRWPSIFFGFASILLTVFHWRKFIGPRMAALMAMVFAISPVFGAFAYQVRGYSLAMFLSLWAMSGLLELLYGDARRGQYWLCLSCFLLPLVMPSAAMLGASLSLFLFWHFASRGRGFAGSLGLALPSFVATALSSLYYVSIWEQFVAASRSAGGWPSSWLCAGNLALGFAAHLGPLVFLLLALFAVRLPRLFSRRSNRLLTGARLLLCSVLPIAALLLLRLGGRAPFPRVFLVYLPSFSLAAALMARPLPFIRRQRLMYLIVFVLLSGCLVERYCSSLSQRQVLDGASPQNLLQQYYRNASDNRDSVAFMRGNGFIGNSLVIVNEWDAPSFRYYWQLSNLPMQALFVSNLMPEDFWLNPEFAQYRLLVQARNESEASQMFAKAGYRGPFHVAHKSELRQLYVIGYGDKNRSEHFEFAGDRQ